MDGMVINIKGQEVELKYTFNSFKYMQELDMGELQELERKPFKILNAAELLLLGAVNHNPAKKFSIGDVQAFLEKFIVDGSISDLLEELMNSLQESNFFKSLQKNMPKETQE